MGLYQYIREQKHRRDLVGELGRSLIANPAQPLDSQSWAFRLAAHEFERCCEWTRKDAIARLNANQAFNDIAAIEPRVRALVSEVIRVNAARDYSRPLAYSGPTGKVERKSGTFM